MCSTAEFVHLSFEQANINVIAEQAGIGKGMIYLYFENKRTLFVEKVRAIAQVHLQEIRTALGEGGSLRERLKRLFLTFVRLAEQDSDSFPIFMSALYGVNRLFHQEATALLREYVIAITQLLKDGQARGEIAVQELETSALMVLTITESYVLAARVLGSSPAALARQAEVVASFILMACNLQRPGGRQDVPFLLTTF